MRKRRGFALLRAPRLSLSLRIAWNGTERDRPDLPVGHPPPLGFRSIVSFFLS